MDYNCPFCKKSSPDLEEFVDDDGKVRLVYKDWPILTDASVMAPTSRWRRNTRASIAKRMSR